MKLAKLAVPTGVAPGFPSPRNAHFVLTLKKKDVRQHCNPKKNIRLTKREPDTLNPSMGCPAFHGVSESERSRGKKEPLINSIVPRRLARRLPSRYPSGRGERLVHTITGGPDSVEVGQGRLRAARPANAFVRGDRGRAFGVRAVAHSAKHRSRTPQRASGTLPGAFGKQPPAHRGDIPRDGPIRPRELPGAFREGRGLVAGARAFRGARIARKPRPYPYPHRYRKRSSGGHTAPLVASNVCRITLWGLVGWHLRLILYGGRGSRYF